MTIHLPNHKTTTLRSLCEQTLISKQITLRDLSKLILKLRATAPAITPAPPPPPSDKVPATMPNKKPENKIVLRNSSNPRSKLHFRTKMVDRKHKLDRGETTFNPVTRNSHILGCSQIRGLGGGGHQQAYPQEGCGQQERTAYQYSGINASKVCHKNIHQTKESVFNPHTDRQHHSTELFSENGGNEKQNIDKNFKRNLAISSTRKDHSYSRMDPKQGNFSGRLGIQECKGSLRMDSKASSFSKNMQNDESDSKHRSFCFTGSPPVEAIHEQEAGPKFNSGGCSTTKLENIPSIHFPPILPYSKNFEKIDKEEIPALIVTPLWPTAIWYPLLLNMCIRNPSLLLKEGNLLTNPQGEIHPLIKNGILGLVVWFISGNPLLRKEYLEKLQNSCQVLDDRAHSVLMIRPGKNGVCGVVNEMLIPLDVI